MPPFLFMKKFTFIVDDISLPTMSDYTTMVVKEPTIVKLSDGSGAVKFDSYTGYWISQQQMNAVLANAVDDTPKAIQKPEGSVSELTLLKAMAIAQQPELALNLLKE